jgi:penicillin-binding protein 1A
MRSRDGAAAMSFHHPAGPGEPSTGRRGLLRLLPWELRLIALALLYLGPPLALVVGAVFVYFTLNVPDPMALRLKEQTPAVRVLARDGSVLGERGGGDGYVPIDLLPRHLVDAVVATEDRRFFRHWGVDPGGLARAAMANMRAGRIIEGGSTLTQQLAKNLFLGSERTLVRKLEEVVLALWLEARLGKRNILELYLNRVYFGAGAYGVETAARRFFGKSAREVTLIEAATLAGLLKAPSRYSPGLNPAVARDRAQGVLARMVDAGLLSRRRADEAAAAPLRFSPALQSGRSGAGYAIDAVLDQLPQLVGVEAGDLVVETTLDAALQQRAQALVQAAIAGDGAAGNVSQAGLVIMDTRGGVRALIGGHAYPQSQFNRALKARRQPGSAFKMYVYLAALERGLTPDSTVLDLPILGSGWSPRNEGPGYRGAVTLREALAQSMNAATARLHMTVGPRTTAAVAQRLGIRSRLAADASLALGTSEVTLVELTGAYGVLANGGRSVEPHLVTRVRTGRGRVLYARGEERQTVLVAPAHVAAMNDMLSTVLASGTGRRAGLAGHPAAGKTGTSQGFRDAWFVGYTGRLAAGVWVGNDDGSPMRRVMGGSLPATLWHDVMTIAHEGSAPVALPGALPPPPGAVAAPRSAPMDEGQRATAGHLLPRERIAPEFFERAVADTEEAALLPPEGQHPQTAERPGWMGSAKALLRGLGFGT